MGSPVIETSNHCYTPKTNKLWYVNCNWQVKKIIIMEIQWELKWEVTVSSIEET